MPLSDHLTLVCRSINGLKPTTVTRVMNALRGALSRAVDWEIIDAHPLPSDNGEHLVNVKNSWTSIVEAAAIPSFRWHDMRHDFVSKHVIQGVPLNTVRELCRHAELNTTLRYAHLAPDHKADAIALIG